MPTVAAIDTATSRPSASQRFAASRAAATPWPSASLSAKTRTLRASGGRTSRRIAELRQSRATGRDAEKPQGAQATFDAFGDDEFTIRVGGAEPHPAACASAARSEQAGLVAERRFA